MVNESNAFKRALSFQWIKARSGNTYICPANALHGIENPSEGHLRSLCIDESENPQND
jgi:hypothetical protein